MEHVEENKWLLATFGAAFVWAIADVLCDSCIGEGDEADDGFELVPLRAEDGDLRRVNKSEENLPAMDSRSSGRWVSAHSPNGDNGGVSSSSSGLKKVRTKSGNERPDSLTRRVTRLAKNNSSGDEAGSGLRGHTNGAAGFASTTSRDAKSPSGASPSLDQDDFGLIDSDGAGRAGSKSPSSQIDADQEEQAQFLKRGNPSDLDQDGNDSSDEDDDNDDDDDDDDDSHLDGTQDCAVAGLSTGVVMYLLSLKRMQTNAISMFVPPAGHSGAGGALGAREYLATGTVANVKAISFIWSPLHDIEWWLASLSGVLMFLHYFFLLQAYDSAPSTVINPLIQVSSTWMLLGSAVPAALAGTTFIRPFDLLCYFVIVTGGILPSLNGDIRTMLHLKFWKQRYVRNTVLSEVLVGVYDLIMSYSLQSSAKKEKFREIATTDMEFEFFFIAWSGFVISFCMVFAWIPSLRQKFINLRRIPRKILVMSAVGQLLTLLGYYFSQFAYSWYYQASIVHAAEASLSQALNLMMALVAQKFFDLGRASAISNLRVKVVSCAVVSIGLFMLSFSEASTDEGIGEAGPLTSHGVDGLPSGLGHVEISPITPP